MLLPVYDSYICLQMKDLLGIMRGKCRNMLPVINEACPCPGYQIEANAARGACCLCECPSVLHESVGKELNPYFV